MLDFQEMSEIERTFEQVRDGLEWNQRKGASPSISNCLKIKIKNGVNSPCFHTYLMSFLFEDVGVSHIRLVKYSKKMLTNLNLLF